MGIFEVAGDQALEPFLTGSVPELKTDDFPAGCNIFADKIDSDGGLFELNDTFLVGSNSLRI